MKTRARSINAAIDPEEAETRGNPEAGQRSLWRAASDEGLNEFC